MIVTDILEELVDRLTVPCPEKNPRGEWVANDPLLQRLREGITSSVGGTRGGVIPAAERSVINVAAFDLYEDLDGRISVLAQETRGLPEERLRRWRVGFEAKRVRGEVSETEWLTMVALVGTWVRRVEDMFDPPMTREVLAPCPVCGARYVLDQGGLQQSALYAEYRRGFELIARCRRCASRWRGETQLITLAHTINAEVDVHALAEFRG